MAKKTTTKTPRKDKIPDARPLAVAKPKFDELLRLVSKPKGGKKKSFLKQAPRGEDL